MARSLARGWRCERTRAFAPRAPSSHRARSPAGRVHWRQPCAPCFSQAFQCVYPSWLTPVLPGGCDTPDDSVDFLRNSLLSTCAVSGFKVDASGTSRQGSIKARRSLKAGFVFLFRCRRPPKEIVSLFENTREKGERARVVGSGQSRAALAGTPPPLAQLLETPHSLPQLVQLFQRRRRPATSVEQQSIHLLHYLFATTTRNCGRPRTNKASTFFCTLLRCRRTNR